MDFQISRCFCTAAESVGNNKGGSQMDNVVFMATRSPRGYLSGRSSMLRALLSCKPWESQGKNCTGKEKQQEPSLESIPILRLDQ